MSQQIVVLNLTVAENIAPIPEMKGVEEGTKSLQKQRELLIR